MPYIKIEERKEYDVLVDQLAEKLNILDNDVLCGHLNYVFSRLCWQLGGHKFQDGKKITAKNYARLNAVTGALENAKLEFYRQVVSPYEDYKIAVNGSL